MNQPETKPLRIKLPASVTRKPSGGGSMPLPGILGATTRGGGSELDPLLEGIEVRRTYDFVAPTRGRASGAVTSLDTTQPELLALEAEDGTTIFIRSDALAEAVARVRPEAVDDQGEVDFAKFRDPNATARGVGDILWKVASVLTLPKDGLLKEAEDLATKWAREKLGDLATGKPYDVASFLGAKALMWSIESRLAGRPGLYLWRNRTLDASDRCLPGDPRLKPVAEGKPTLVLIHGTGSHTLGSFADLRQDDDAWDLLERRFPGGVFGYEHRTFSESPTENALALLDALPKGAKVSLLTHSRGGLVGDLLCLGQVTDAVINACTIDTRDAHDAEGLEREAQEERTRLRGLHDRLAGGHITVERYVRVACPARGTRFLSENLDVALSDFLNLLQWGGGAIVGATAVALGGPVAGQRFGKGASSILGVVKRLALEIAGRRIDPRLVPGIAAMRVESPLAAFLAHPDTRRRDGINMAVIAGDTEFDGLGLSNLRRRIANLFCDWRLFDRHDNDLVVDTDSMYAGLALREGAKYLYVQDETVSHFQYFRNRATADAMRSWLVEDDLERVSPFLPITAASKVSWQDREARLAQRGEAAGPRPVVILIPGIMGTHLEIKRRPSDKPGSGNRIWFDLASLFVGRLGDLSDPNAAKVAAEDLFEMFYGDLADHLALSHNVIRCPYDWRQPLDKCAEALAARIQDAARRFPGQPIRLLAHSMGGLVARTLMANHESAWKTVTDSGGRLVMLGTPNNGSHLMVHTLLGKSSSIRKLEKIDVAHDMNGILKIVAGFPGALALLPRPDGFTDAGHQPGIVEAAEYYEPRTWQELRRRNTDRWYGDGIGADPAAPLLEQARRAWNDLPVTLPNPERVVYVYGQSDQTPCGVLRGADGRLKLLFTSCGDGSVTWKSGQIESLEERSWYMPVEHADLTGEEDYFPAIVELLEKGTTDKLGRLPRERGLERPPVVLEAEPPVVAGEEELARAFLGSGLRRRKTTRGRQVLEVSAWAGDVRFLDQPVLCGHYIGDVISGAEAALDELLEGALSERERMSVYAGEIGTSTIVLRPPTGEERARGSLPGAVVVGLGQFTGQLSARQVTETVRGGVLRLLLQLRDALGLTAERPVTLCSFLIGWSSTTNLSVSESVAAIARGVLEANRRFRDAVGKSQEPVLAVTKLTFVELFRDAAITAASAVLDLPELLAGELPRLGARIEPANALVEGEGVIERLGAAGDLGHWSRLIVTDAEAPEVRSAPECCELRWQSPLPPALLRQLSGQGGHLGKPNTTVPPPPAENQSAGPPSGTPDGTVPPAEPASVPLQAVPFEALPTVSRYYPRKLKYVFLSARARAEVTLQHRQPGLIEAIIRDQRHNPAYDARLGHTLFQLMVPLDYKAVARDQSRLLLVLDDYTANLPWELLRADEEPLVVKIPMVRQLATMRYRPAVRTASRNAACIIVNPSTDGYDKRFPGGKPRLDDLPRAVDEGRAISDSLHRAGWSDADIVLTPPEKSALDIFATLYDRPYRVLVICAHGIFEARAMDGRAYSGVVLSDGLLITAVEMAQMEVVPEVVFLSCCHLGSISNPYSEPNRLAYSLAQQLIESGARCVVAAGWAVNDEAACTFASAFFDHLTQGNTFGDAIFYARRVTHRQHPATNTWGAYQAYGDPGYRLRPGGEEEAGRRRPLVAVAQLLAAIQGRRIKNKRLKGDSKAPSFSKQRQWVESQLAKCPPEWKDRPDVLQAIGELYGDSGAEGFESARDAYERAVQLEDQVGRVAVKTIEQLANLEARRGGKLADQGKHELGLKLIESGIRRMKALAQTVGGQGPPAKNAERAGILGSAYKLQATALSRLERKSWSDISAALGEAGRAYQSAVEGDPARKPYNTLNALTLAWLSGTLDQPPREAIALARRCGEQARKDFAADKGFWNAVMSADAALTAWLMGDPLDKPLESLRRCYDEAVAKVPNSAREWDSVVKQWRILAGFLRLRRQGDRDRNLSDVLEKLAESQGLATSQTAGRPPGTAAQQHSREAAAAKITHPRRTKHKRRPS